MYKLTVISGPNRGSSFAIREGENLIGRQAGNTVVLSSSQISKKHALVTVSEDGSIMIQDQGSANGTFVNGHLVDSHFLKPGDKIGVGEFVLLLKKASKKSSQNAPALSGFGNVVQFPGSNHLPVPMGSGSEAPAYQHAQAQAPVINSSPQVAPQIPSDPKEKLAWYLEQYVMPFFYSMTLKKQWRTVGVNLLAIMILGGVVISIYPLLEANRTTVVKESGKRAQFMAKQLAERNTPFLAQGLETKLEIGTIDREDGVRLAVITDLDNRIIAPTTKLNQYLSMGSEAALAVKLRGQFRKGRETGVVVETDASTVVAVEPIKIFSPQLAQNIVAGMAIVSVDTSLATPDVGEMGMIYSQTLILTGLLGGFIFFVLYRLTLKPFEVLNDEIDKVLKGDQPQVTHEFKLEELNPLWEIINSALQRASRGSTGAEGAEALGSGGGSVEDAVAPLKSICENAQLGLVICNSDKRVVYLNPIFEELSGVRGDSSIGQALAEVVREQSLVALLNDLFERAASGVEAVSEDYEFSGTGYKVWMSAFSSGPGAIRGYALTVAKVVEHG